MVAGLIHCGRTIWNGAGLDTMRENEPFLVMVTLDLGEQVILII